MKWYTLITATLTLGLLSMAGNAGAQESTIDFVVAGPADWNVAGSWNAPGFGAIVPGDGFPAEIVSISNAGIAELTSPASFPVQGLVIGETHNPNRAGGPNATEEVGTLNISGSGALSVTGPTDPGAALRIGDGGLGTLNFSGGTLATDSLSVGGDKQSALNLSGDAALAVSTDAGLGRFTRIEGPNVVFDVEGNLNLGGTFIPVITGATHSPITVGGNTSAGGTLQVQFNGHTPALGDSWTLIDGSTVAGTFANVDTSAAGALPLGTVFTVAYDRGGSGDVELEFANRLVLTVNQATGAGSISNLIGDVIDMDGYTIASPSGSLSVSGWNSLEDQGLDAWNEASPSSGRLSELNPTGSSSLIAGDPGLDLGAMYASVAINADPDLTFSYATTDGQVLDGIVQIEGINSLVLEINTVTGAAALTNPTIHMVDLDGYAIGSESGSLLPGGFDGFASADWEDANLSATHLTELNPFSASTLNPGATVNLGMVFDTAGMQDLTLEFHLDGGGELSLFGGVEYVESMGGQIGDTNGDGVVNIDDLNSVRNNFGTGDGTDLSGIPGDSFPFDGFVNLDDLNGVRNNFGAGASPVPEPSSVLLASFGCLAIGAVRRRTRR